MSFVQVFDISKIYFHQIKNWVLWFFLYSLLFPVGLVFFVRVVGNDGDPVRLVAGATILSISTISINTTCYWIMTDRFEHRLELLMSMPITSYTYYSAIVLVSILQSTLNVHALIVIMLIFGFEINYSLLILVAILPTTILLSLVGILVGNIVKDTSHGSLIMNLLSTGAVLICPIFYPASVLPKSIAGVAILFPHTIAFRIFYSIYSQ